MPDPSLKDESSTGICASNATPGKAARISDAAAARERFTRTAPKSLECTVIRAGPKTKLISVPEAARQSGRPW